MSVPRQGMVKETKGHDCFLLFLNRRRSAQRPCFVFGAPPPKTERPSLARDYFARRNDRRSSIGREPVRFNADDLAGAQPGRNQ
jgi:hypothetical protein